MGRNSRAVPRVALETAFLTTGLPEEVRLATARAMVRSIRERGAEAAFAGVVGGTPVVGIDDTALERLASAGRKLATRDLPLAVAEGADGGTTVSATLFLAHRAGVAVMATGGIGGVHRSGSTGSESARDESADLIELSRTPVILVCSGAKAILDLAATMERLETLGVTVIGCGTEELPAFWSSESGIDLPHTVADTREAAAVGREARALGLPGAVLVCVPPPAQQALPREESDRAVEEAAAQADRQSISGAALTPFLLSRIAEITDGRSLSANRALLENNAGVAAEIAVALAADPAT